MQTDLGTHLLDLVAFDARANRALASTLAGVAYPAGPAPFDASAVRTACRLFALLVEDEERWLNRARQADEGPPEVGADLASSAARAERSAAAWRDLLGGVDDVGRPVRCASGDGEAVEVPLHQVVAHAVARAGRQRERVAQLLTDVGLAVPGREVLVYGAGPERRETNGKAVAR